MIVAVTAAAVISAIMTVAITAVGAAPARTFMVVERASVSTEAEVMTLVS